MPTVKAVDKSSSSVNRTISTVKIIAVSFVGYAKTDGNVRTYARVAGESKP